MWRPSDRQLVCGVAAIIFFAVSSAGLEVHRTDFASFYQSGLTWRGLEAGTSVRPDLNPPILAPILALFSFLPLPSAFGLWTVLGLASLAASLRAIARERGMSPDQWTWTVIAVIGFMPCLLVWMEGQIVWLLLYPFTRSWLAKDAQTAGLWLAPVIAIKPPLALMALLLPFSTWFVAGTVSASLTGLAILIMGWQPWAEWLALSRVIDWLPWPINVSLFGVAARLQSGRMAGVSVAHLWPFWWPGLLMIVLCLWIWPKGRWSHDQRWVNALLGSLLISPLGWLYYLPLSLGPVLALGRLPILPILLLAMPMPLLSVLSRAWPDLAIWWGSVYAAGTVWITVLYWRRHV